jgi:hypothetical protein
MNQNPKVLSLTPEEAAKVQRARSKAEATSIDEEWLFISEFGYYYGWEGVKTILNNEIDLNTAATLLIGAKKVWYSKLVDSAVATYTANAAAQSKKPKQVMANGLKGFMKEAKL